MNCVIFRLRQWKCKDFRPAGAKGLRSGLRVTGAMLYIDAMKTFHVATALSALLLASTALAQGWEDESTVPARMPGQARRAQPARQQAQPRQATPRQGDVPSASVGSVLADLYSLHLDAPVDPAYWLSLGIFPGSTLQIGEGDDISWCEIDGRWDMAFFRDILEGDIDLGIRMHDLFFTGDGGVDATPDFLLGLAADAGWTWRFLDGGSVEARFAPGIYSSVNALGGGMLSFPFRGAYYRVLSPEASIMAGAEIRPGWDMVFMPLLGLAWQPSDMFRLDLAIPRTRAFLYAWRFTAFGAIEWRNATYNMKGGSDPDSVTLDDIILSVGGRFRLSDEFHIGAEIGKSVRRGIEFEKKDTGADIGIDSVGFIRFFVGGPF